MAKVIVLIAKRYGDLRLNKSALDQMLDKTYAKENEFL